MNKEEISTSVTAEGTAEGLSTHSIKSPPPVASTSNPVTPSVRANSDSAEQEVTSPHILFFTLLQCT